MADKQSVPALVRMGWKIERWQGRYTLPAGRTLGSALFYGRSLLSTFWNVAMQILIREPALRFRCQRLGSGLRLYGPAPLIIGDGRIEIGERVEIAAPCSMAVGLGLPAPALLHIGDDVHIGQYNVICAATSVTIGNHCRTGPYVCIYDTDMHPQDAQLRREDFRNGAVVQSAPVVIEDDVWLGVGVIVLKGVTIGRAAIVGAGTVVTRDVPPYSMVAGNPPTVIGRVTDAASQPSDAVDVQGA